MLDRFLDWLAARLKEKTTYVGLVGFAATVAGYSLAPEQAQTYAEIGAVVGGVVSAALIARKDKPS